MKPDWDKLMNKYASSQAAFVAEVDCTTAGRSLCDDVGVRGYPTIKYGSHSEGLQDYQGGRDFQSLDKFAASLKAPCGPDMMHLCDEPTKRQIQDWQRMDPKDLDVLIKEKEDQIAAADKGLREEVDKLQKRYQELEDEREKKIEELTNSGYPLPMLKQVKNYMFPYQPGYLEKFYYAVAGPTETFLKTVGLDRQVHFVQKAVTDIYYKTKANAEKAWATMNKGHDEL